MKAAVIYLLAVLCAQLTATHFIPFPVFGAVAVGTFIFGVTFTQRDHMHRKGKPFVYGVIVMSAVMSLGLLLSIRFGGGAWLAFLFRSLEWGAFSEWLAGGYELLAESSWRVFVASSVAILIAEAMDTEVYHRLRNRSWLVRVTRSNAVSIPVDSILFNVIAFAGIFGNWLLVQVIFGEIVIKGLVSVIYGVSRRPREAEEPGMESVLEVGGADSD